MKKEIEKRTKMKMCINISFPSKIRFRKKVHSQASDHVWFFLTYSQSVRAKKTKRENIMQVEDGLMVLRQIGVRKLLRIRSFA